MGVKATGKTSRDARPTVVAIPARDEAERIGACLEALLDQRGLDRSPLDAGAVRIVVVANNCADRTADIARGFGRGVDVIALDLPPPRANAGVARRLAMDAAAELLPADGDGLICTTDADSRPRPDWIARLWKAIDTGAEAVAGAVDFDPDETGPRVSPARALEARYSALQAEVIARLDPETHNPWPNHIWAWGANLAVTASAYRRVGGMPPRALAEDRAFVEELRRRDVPVRHCLDARVWTSPRRLGRAEGGLASLIDAHGEGDGAPCDAALEPVRDLWRRTALRARLRNVYAREDVAHDLPQRLRVPRRTIEKALASNTFGAAWSAIEAASPALTRNRLHVGALPREILRAERLLRRVRPHGPGDPADSARVAAAGLWSAPGQSPR